MANAPDALTGAALGDARDVIQHARRLAHEVHGATATASLLGAGDVSFAIERGWAIVEALRALADVAEDRAEGRDAD